MKDRIAALAVGLAADCDSPESDVQKIMGANLPGAGTLPFAGFITHDGKWVAGFSGYKDAPGFLKILESAETSPLLNASEAVRKKVAGLAEKAGKAAEKGEWKSVMGAAKEASETTGRCAERATIAGLVTKAREWAAGQFEAAVKVARSGGDLAEARKVLGEVKKHFSGEPEGAEADAGLKALQRLSNIQTAEAGPAPPAGIREKALKEYQGTRWAAVFEKRPAAAAEPPKDAPR